MEQALLEKIGASQEDGLIDIKLSLADDKATTDEIAEQIKAIRASYAEGKSVSFIDQPDQDYHF